MLEFRAKTGNIQWLNFYCDKAFFFSVHFFFIYISSKIDNQHIFSSKNLYSL